MNVPANNTKGPSPFAWPETICISDLPFDRYQDALTSLHHARLARFYWIAGQKGKHEEELNKAE